MRAALAFGLAMSTALSVAGQERYGIALSNYAGTDGAMLNPARSAGQWPWLDVRLMGVDAHAWNSLIAWTGRERSLLGELRGGSGYGSVVLRSAMASGTHKAIVEAGFSGPGVSVALGRTTIGAGIRSRLHVSAAGISPSMGNFIFHGLSYAPQHGVRYSDEGMRAVGAAWTELGVNIGQVLKAEGFGVLSAGANLRYLQAHAGAAIGISDLEYTVVDTALAMVHSATLDYGFAMPAANAGNGFGADLGLTYTRTIDEADGYMPHRSSGGCSPAAYRYRVGLSLLDLGGMRFRSAQAGRLEAGMLRIDDYTDMPLSDASDADSLIASSTRWTRSQGMTIGLPTALSAQFDCRISGPAFVAFAMMQNVSGRSSLRMRRANSMVVAPRIETKHFEAAMPLVFHEYDLSHPTLGLMLRFEGLVIGSDHVLPFINRRDMHAADVYARLRWMIHRSPFCRGKRSARRNHAAGSTESLPCATPND